MEPRWKSLPDGRGSDWSIAPRNRVLQSEPRPLGSGLLLFGYLLATGSYKFRVLDGCVGTAGLAGFVLLCARWSGCRQERGGHLGQFGFLFRAQRLDEVRG